MFLNGWKEISNHLQRGVRSAQRWERLGLPVTRINNTVRSPVIARSEDLDQWLMRQSKGDLLLTKFAEAHKQAAATRRRSAELIQASEQLRKRSHSLRHSRSIFGFLLRRFLAFAPAVEQNAARVPRLLSKLPIFLTLLHSMCESTLQQQLC